jgi:Flp pilus assembly protein TadD
LERGRELLVAGDVNAAIGELSIAASIDSKSGEVNKLLAIAYESKGLRDRALQSFELALHSDEKNAEHLNNLGYLLYKNGDYERATKYLKRAAKISPNDARIWNNLALTQCQRGKFEEAYTSFVRAVGEFSAHSNLAGQLQARGYAKDAIKHLEIAQALNPNSVDVLTKLVSLYELTGRPTDAETTRRSLVALKTFATPRSRAFGVAGPWHRFVQVRHGNWRRVNQSSDKSPHSKVHGEDMGNLSFLTRAEIESLGPPTPEELEETDVSEAFLRDLALKHVASLTEPSTNSVAEKLHLPLALTDELLYQLYREKLIEIRLQSAVG